MCWWDQIASRYGGFFVYFGFFFWKYALFLNIQKITSSCSNLREWKGEDRGELAIFLLPSITTFGLYQSLINLAGFTDCFSLLHHPKYLTIINSGTTKHQ